MIRDLAWEQRPLGFVAWPRGEEDYLCRAAIGWSPTRPPGVAEWTWAVDVDGRCRCGYGRGKVDCEIQVDRVLRELGV